MKGTTIETAHVWSLKRTDGTYVRAEKPRWKTGLYESREHARHWKRERGYDGTPVKIPVRIEEGWTVVLGEPRQGSD